MRECELFVQACEQEDPAQREEFLDRACGGDVDLRRRVDRLLESRENLDDFMEPVDTRSLESDAPDRVGQKLGPYVLRELIGEGGFGVVYVAEQRKPISRKGAIKLIKPGMDSQEIVARFEAERQALAMMDHPNIAKVLDAGSSSEGHPYFVMELVPGVPITDYTATHQVPLRERLALMKSVCEAVEHAHKKGIIHRDLKPSNVLITLHDGQPVVKIIDFGVAKALHGQLTDRTVYTAMGQLLGTPMYMSPEQAELSGLDIDTRSDVYSLGVLLYELLTGLTPFDRESFQQAGFTDRLRMIREHEPLRPSLRVSTAEVAADRTRIDDRREINARRLSDLLKGELDWIVMKALEKKREQRYDSSKSLAEDIEAYLLDKPVKARPASTWYRFRKFVRRRKTSLALGGGASILALALASSVVWAWLADIDRRHDAEQRAELILGQATRLAEKDNLPEALAAVKTASSLLNSAGSRPATIQRIDRLVDEFELLVHLEEARLAAASWTHEGHSCGLNYRDADERYRVVFNAAEVDIAEMEPAETAEFIHKRFKRTQKIIEGLDRWAICSRLLHDREAPRTHWASDVVSRRRLQIANRLDPNPLRRKLRDWLAGSPENVDRQQIRLVAASPETYEARLTTQLVVGVLMACGQDDEAIEVLQRNQLHYPGDFFANFDLASAIYRGGREVRSEAKGFYLAALAIRPANAVALGNLAICYSHEGRSRDAEVLAREAVKHAPESGIAHNILGETLRRQGRYSEAKKHYQKAIALSPDFPHP